MKKSIKIISILLIVCLLFITSCNVIPNQANSSYVVQFIDYDGSLLKEQKVEEGKSAIPPTDPTREGYVFIGWDTEYTNVTSDLTITALYEKEIDTITYTVIFNTNSDTIIDPIIVSENQTIKEPLKPSKEGYIFEGWYLNEEKWDFENNKVTANITLTAKWTEEITLPENSSDLEFTLKENYEYEVTGLMNKSLTKLIIPEYYCGRKVTSIGDMAFYFCSSLTSIEIPNSVTSIRERTFLSCTNLENINVDKNNLYYKSIDGNLYTKDGKTLIQYAIGKQQKTFIIPNSVTSIGEGAFEDCYSLTSIEIPNSVTSIGAYAFSDCDSLTSIEIPNSVTSIGDMAFSGCDSLTSIEIPNSVTSIEDRAFYWCSSLTSIEIPNSITSIGEGAFSDCYNLTSIEIPNSVTSIGKGAFRYCFNLTIYCESLSKPSGWDTYWNRDDCPVVWGYIVEE